MSLALQVGLAAGAIGFAASLVIHACALVGRAAPLRLMLGLFVGCLVTVGYALVLFNLRAEGAWVRDGAGASYVIDGGLSLGPWGWAAWAILGAYVGVFAARAARGRPSDAQVMATFGAAMMFFYWVALSVCWSLVE